MEVKTIRQTVRFNAAPRKVYGILMSSRSHSAFTGDRARIDYKAGGKFSAYGGGLNGYNLELKPGRRIVQAWRCEEPGWPKGYYSTAIFDFRKSGKGTKLVFTQHGVPGRRAASIARGWKDYYWKPMAAYLAE